MTWRDGDFAKALGCQALVIGAGGIGCELLKNLALTGFKNITVIDLDTIDISNLNRQFLFRKEHVGKSKAEVATEAIRQIRPDINITFHHDSIMSEKFGVEFFQRFAIVLSALDNKAARSHVNRLCLVSGVSLIESGSAGYLGQVSVILKGKSECYDCVPKSVQKTYPNCTIRNTPSEPIHCVVWAKALFNQLFGEKDPDNDVAPEVEDTSVNGHTNGNGKQLISTRQFAENCDYDPVNLFNKLFHDDVNYLLSMTDLWKERKKPVPRNFDELTAGGLGPSKEQGPNMPWSLSKWAEVYETAVYALHKRYVNAAKTNGVLAWDKDDEPAMNFVAACSNIRSHVFQIPTKTLFDIKSMAGNIIPAVATTNACVAGMIVIEALKIIRNQLDKCRCVFIARQPNPRGKILVDELPCKPNPQCYVCSDQREVIVRVNLDKMLVKHLRQCILLGAFNMRSPDVTDLFSQRILLSSDEEETEGLMEKTLSSLSVRNGTQLDCDDFAQHLQFKLLVFHAAELEAEQFEVVSSSSSNITAADELKQVGAVGEAADKVTATGEMTAEPIVEMADDLAQGTAAMIVEPAVDEPVLMSSATGEPIVEGPTDQAASVVEMSIVEVVETANGGILNELVEPVTVEPIIEEADDDGKPAEAAANGKEAPANGAMADVSVIGTADMTIVEVDGSAFEDIATALTCRRKRVSAASENVDATAPSSKRLRVQNK